MSDANEFEPVLVSAVHLEKDRGLTPADGRGQTPAVREVS